LFGKSIAVSAAHYRSAMSEVLLNLRAHGIRGRVYQSQGDSVTPKYLKAIINAHKKYRKINWPELLLHS